MAKAKKTPQKISRTEAIAKLKAHRETGNGRIFSVTFEKRGEGGGIREMRARFKVKSALKGGKQPYKPEEQALMTVFDVAEQDYRNINLLGLQSLKIDGVEFTVKAS